jgi:hypothetical protein
MSDMRTATIRTTVPTIWTTLVAWAVARFGFDLSDADWQVLLLVLPFLAGIGYRLLRVVEARWPKLGYILFGSARLPHYDAPEAVDGEES